MKYKVDTPIQYLKGVGPEAAKVFKNLGVETVEDLLTLAPKRYVGKNLIKDLNLNEESRTVGRIINTGMRRTSRGLIFAVQLSDGTGTINLSFFNYSKKATSNFKWNKLIEVEGIVSFWGRNLQIVNPTVTFSPPDEEKFLPIYPLSQRLTHKYIRKVVRTAFANDMKISETLPSHILEKEKLPSREEAIHNLHFPQELKFANLARQRLEFEEVFWFQILLALRKKKIKKQGIKFEKGSELARQFYETLRHNQSDKKSKSSKKNGEFKLTNAQRRVIWEIYKDMESDSKMNRLLQGDVGSGKTIIAILSMLKAVESGYQAVLMAPTEVLAEQHYFKLSRYLPKIGIKLGLLIGSLSAQDKRKVKEEIKNGKAQIIIGTHALIESSVTFKNLGFIVIDEQHKFGVVQRLKLAKKSKSPDILVLTATPIPRSLALTIYGDLDISIIDEMPPGVGEICTKWIYANKIQEAWKLVKSELKQGRQCYIVYPVIDESEKLDLKAAQEEYEKLSTGIFKDYEVGLLHGRLNRKEKAKVMKDFSSGKLNILIATTVIEVGIDIPNASCMVIEHAERFGLSQLHQLRGRLRRGKTKSHCILISPKKLGGIAKERLNAIEKEEDGFKLAEKDLELRGAGEFLGTRQHGLPELKLANIMDTQLLSRVRNITFKIIENDPRLEKPENKIIANTVNYRYREKFEFLEGG